MCRMSTQTYCKNLLSMCVAMCVFISCNIYVALGARGLNTQQSLNITNRLLLTSVMKSADNCYIIDYLHSKISINIS